MAGSQINIDTCEIKSQYQKDERNLCKHKSEPFSYVGKVSAMIKIEVVE